MENKYETLQSILEGDTVLAAESLLGSILVLEQDGHHLMARIVETEAYLGIHDKACHSYGGRITPRNSVLYRPAGTLYVYFTYGMHYLLNIVTGDVARPEAVLIRGVEPLGDINPFAMNRYGQPFDTLTPYQKKHITNGPGKLTKALGISKVHNGTVLGERVSLELQKPTEAIVATARIGIDYAEEARDWPLRFYLRGNGHVSKR
ncbi:DNA-3-methyladenine glycosylase [Peptoniphilus equinus]|uniref:Putative 3-methyladenine DNA glycosylase n=1 Tax=Peptoniphilus equinus TaxID=3016343 RepID=A0ABY7QRS4_9FIRM|nr:DNA-3-methyladenine glycosylase [Peptoniphilus equinus]WBW49487.1 DNA-3-methyladenine glycosylase [Peptoniphilus equinus]